MIIRKPADIPSSEITSESTYLSRRQFVGGAGALLSSAILPYGLIYSGNALANASRQSWEGKTAEQFKNISMSKLSTSEEKTPYKDILQYNNFYEFGTGKGDPAQSAGQLDIDPWSIEVSGECNKPGKYPLESLLLNQQLEERIYRLRCVEAWSMVIPWVGIPLASILNKFEPNGNAKYVAFETLYRPKQMPGQSSLFSGIDWPYREGLRMDEAMHPLTLAAVGLYGKILPNQNGAPFRLVIPWKYGFKSIKSIVKIHFTKTVPATTWNMQAPQEYGFYANVNPAVDHPRWSQKRERRLPGGFLGPKRIETLPFNGYGEQVANLYQGMDLKVFY